MASEKVKFETVDDYIASFPPEVQHVLRQMQSAIREAIPEAEEVISYQLPAFSYQGMVIYYSAYKDHYSISVPPPFTVFEAFKEELSGYEMSKTAVKFPASQPVPLELIQKIAAFKANENLQKALSKKKKK
ncbi:hypothetical protein E5161_16115 [Cohnella pontilimi]|uniref:YdhG-like domain-containing protein n=1 Tax=Cohnella pontilimi TaxID=2564100 RepID=A0A4U0F852_9BACL|nr:DUF1801 domain-containing protein [Cohnella pontilimi]TJY40680.1 hypothetical protein E5161_16115 [Cohnella pontilimi]